MSFMAGAVTEGIDVQVVIEGCATTYTLTPMTAKGP